MMKIASKLAELSQRATDLEAQIARHGRQEGFLGEHARRHRGNADAVGQLEKRLTSLRRSCQILARHLSREGLAVKRPASGRSLGMQS